MRVCCQSGKLFDVIFCIRGDGVTEEHLENVFLISVRSEMPMLFKYLKVNGPCCCCICFTGNIEIAGFQGAP